MSDRPPRFSLGVEEEYLLVDPRTRDLAVDPPPGLLPACIERLGSSVGPEFMRCQLEVATPARDDIAGIREELADRRRGIAEIAAEHGLAIIAASTHPFADWQPQMTTERDRYAKLADDMGVPLRRLLICAMHVHIGIEDDNLRIDLMNQLRYFLPHLLVLSTSSPFWHGVDTNLMSYRLAAFDEMPRTGIPEDFDSFGEYQKHIDALVATDCIEDGTKIWWDIRPSARFPTVEMRICDVCSKLEHALSIVSLYRCLARLLWRYKRMNVTWRRYKTVLINENRWRAMRYGFDRGLIDFGRGEMVAYGDLLEEIIALTREDAEALGCVAEVAGARRIIAEGTSAHRQRRIFDAAMSAGADRPEALRAVVDNLIVETAEGL